MIAAIPKAVISLTLRILFSLTAGACGSSSWILWKSFFRNNLFIVLRFWPGGSMLFVPEAISKNPKSLRMTMISVFRQNLLVFLPNNFSCRPQEQTFDSYH